MSKTLTATAISLLSQATGTDPFIVVGIAWNGIDTTWYSSRDMGISGYNNNITDIGTLKIQQKANNSSTCGSVSLTFSDTDAALKTIIDGQVIEKAAGAIYLGFTGMVPSDLIPLFKGVVVGPAQWSEGQRKVSFSLEMVVDSHELGYSATEDDFPDINPEAQGVPWPIIFGTCAHVPALHIRKHTVGHLAAGIRFFQDPCYLLNVAKTDIALKGNPPCFSYLIDGVPEANVIYVEDGDRFPQDTSIKIMIDDVIFQGTMHGARFTVTANNLPKYTGIAIAARQAGPDINNVKVLWIAKDANGNYPPIANGHCYFNGMTGFGGGGEWFNKCVKQEDGKCWFRHPFINPNTQLLQKMGPGDTISEVYGVCKNGMAQDVASIVFDFKQDLFARPVVGGKSPFGGLISQLNNLKDRDNCWWTNDADIEVRLWNIDDPDIYIASLVPMSSVKCVFGKRKVEGGDGKTKEVFEQIPSTYYTVQLVADYPVHSLEGGPDLYPTGILFHKALCEYDGQNWEDEIYVSGTSSVGPNPVAIIQWILSTFSSLDIDGPAFSRVIPRVSTLSANFAIFDKRNALKVCEEIAFQCKCGLVVDTGVVQITYLDRAPMEAELYTEDQIEMTSLDLTFTSTQEIITKYIGTYTDTYRDKDRLTQVREKKTREFEQVLHSLVKRNRRAQSDTKLLTYRNNVNMYGLRVREDSYYIYNDPANVLAAINFWGYRFSTTWKIVKFKVPMSAVRLQPFDGVVLELTDVSYLGTILIKGVVVSVEFNYNDKSCLMELWLPMKAGSIFEDAGAYSG